MRTTVNIRDEALRLCKQKARELRKPLGEVISNAIIEVYHDKPRAKARTRYNLPVSGEGGLRPGIDLNSSAALEDIMAGSR